MSWMCSCCLKPESLCREDGYGDYRALWESWSAVWAQEMATIWGGKGW